MRRTLASLACLLAPVTAHAGVQAFYSASLATGYAHRNHADDGLTSAFRPEMILAADVAAPLVGVGPYLQVEVIFAPSPGLSGHETLMGGGLTAVLYNRVGFSLAASVGVEAGDLGAGYHPQLALSLFAGARDAQLGAVDLPVGFRLEARPATDALPATAVASLQVDLVAVGMVAHGIGELFSRH